MSAQTNSLKVPLTAVTDITAGGVLKLTNPEGVDLIITRLVLDVTTPSSGAATVDAGVHATGASSVDNLIDGQSVATAGVFDNVSHGGTNGKAVARWAAGSVLTITASATLAGLVGFAHVQFIRA